MKDLFLRACKSEAVDTTPIWLMRQAGRYLKEYRDVREKVDFLTMCRTPELCTEVTLQPIDRFGFDAAILFSDIMTPLESMGVRMDFAPGPIVQDPIRDAAAVDRLRVPEAQEIAPFVNETIRMLRRELASRGGVPLIGFAGAPLTLAAYLVEGKGSKDFAKLRAFLYAEPAAAHRLMDKLATCMARYLRNQIEAGAQAVQLFDTWAGMLGPQEYRQFALPAVQKIFASLSDLPVPKIYFAQNATSFFGTLSEINVDCLSVDWRLSLRDARRMLGKRYALQGNLDPAVLYAPKEVIVRETHRVMREALQGGEGGHVFNLGHGMLPDMPVDSVYALVDAVRAFDLRGALAARAAGSL